MLMSVERTTEDLYDRIVHNFETSTAEAVRRAGLKCDVHVVDGNAKNRRQVCAAPLRQKLCSKTLGKTIFACCPHTPQLRSKFCVEHCDNKDSPEVDFEIVGHEKPGPVGAAERQCLQLEIKQKDTGDTIWVDETIVHPALVQQYFQKVGVDHLDALSAKKKQRVLARKGWALKLTEAMDLVRETWEDLSEEEKAHALPERAAGVDLAAVACKTHKETPAEVAQLAKSAGVLCSCISAGVVVMFKEIFGCESLSQRYFLVADLVDVYPECTLIVHDDACHLHKFALARASLSDHAARIAPPATRYVGDEFHMSGHTDTWCLTHCNPKSPEFSEHLNGVRTSVCEFTFTWLSAYKFQVKK